MLRNDRLHLVLAEHFKDRRVGEAQTDRASFLHKEGTVIDDTAFEKTLNDELLLLELSVDFDQATLQEVEFFSISSSSLKLSTLDHSLRLQKIDDIVQNWIIVSQMLEVRNLLHGSLDELEHLVLVFVDTNLDLVLNFRLHRHDLFELVNREFTQVTVLLGLYSRSREAAIDD